MNKNRTLLPRILLILGMSAVVFTCFAIFTEMKYDINFIEYIRYSMPYSEEEYAYMRDKGTIIYSPDSNAPPLSYIDKETGKHEGLIVDYMSSISIESAMSVVCQPMPWGEIFDQMRQKKVPDQNLVVSAWPVTPCDSIASHTRQKPAGTPRITHRNSYFSKI